MALCKIQRLSGLVRCQFDNLAFRLFGRSRPQLQLAGGIVDNATTSGAPERSVLDDLSVWFAVPKRKHSKSRKRMKTTAQKRLKVKQNIVFDPRTGEVSLMHKMPFNWKDYLPKTD